MTGITNKWTFSLFYYVLFFNVLTKCVLVDSKSITVNVNHDASVDLALPENPAIFNTTDLEKHNNIESTTTTITNERIKEENTSATLNDTRTGLRNLNLGQESDRYAIEITIENNNFRGRVIIDVTLGASLRGEPVHFHIRDLQIQSVIAGIYTGTTIPIQYRVTSDSIRITPSRASNSYWFIIEYTGTVRNDGKGLHRYESEDENYLAMNLYPTNARRVFPCLDEPTESAITSFTFNNVDYTNVIFNSMPEDNSPSFRPLEGPPHGWGMVAHNFVNINIPTANVLLFGRTTASNQDSLTSVAINFYFNALNEWTNKPYFETILNQDGRMHIIAVPDVSRDWVALSTVCIWEPYVFMESVNAVKQRKTALITIAEAMAKQWFGYMIYPENWRFQWVVSGLGTYAAYEVLREFQNPTTSNDVTLLDVNTIFVTDIIQESLLFDAYRAAPIMEPTQNIFDESQIRDQINGLIKYKVPALFRMFRFVFDSEQDFIQIAARALLNNRALQTVNTFNLLDALNSDWVAGGSQFIEDIDDFVEEWINVNGYPLIHVVPRPGGVFVTQERFGFSDRTSHNFPIPLTYTREGNVNFDNINPIEVMDGTATLNFNLDEEEWVLFNIQGQGYYRVNYDPTLWERIIEALDEPERREVIHPLNRATLVDDSLNLARSGRLEYEIPFEIVLTMQHETEYAVWKAFVRNMNFLRKRLVALVEEDEDLDPDIYLRMVRRTIGSVESELGFNPDPLITESAMQSLTRGLVMDHACRANYQPCIAAAVDWFYNDNGDVNPNIPNDIRPAVFCTMVREGDEDIIEALMARLEIENSHYERVVILESLACSQNEQYVLSLLQDTIANDSPFGVEERSLIFKAVVESSYSNMRLAVNFISQNINLVRSRYGGEEKIEDLLYVLADNVADPDSSNDFLIWLNRQNNGLDDNEEVVNRVMSIVEENLEWINNNLEVVYEWIDENSASNAFASIVLLCISITIALFNN